MLIEDADFALEALRRSLAHWLPETTVDLEGSLVDQIRTQAELDAVRQPDNRSGFLLPYDVTRAESFGMRLPVPEGLV